VFFFESVVRSLDGQSPMSLATLTGIHTPLCSAATFWGDVPSGEVPARFLNLEQPPCESSYEPAKERMALYPELMNDSEST